MSLKPLDLTLVEQKDLAFDTTSWIKDNMSKFSANTKNYEVSAVLNTKLAETIIAAIPGAQYKSDEDADDTSDTSGVIFPTCDGVLTDTYNLGIFFTSGNSNGTRSITWDSTENAIKTKLDAINVMLVDKTANKKVTTDSFRGRAISDSSAITLNDKSDYYTYAYDYKSTVFMMRYWKYANLYMLSAPAYKASTTASSETLINDLKTYKYGPTFIFTKLYDKLKQSYVHCVIEISYDTQTMYAYIDGLSGYIQFYSMNYSPFGIGFPKDVNKQERVLHAKQLIIGGRYYSESLFIVDSVTFPLVPNNITDVTNPFDKNAGFFTIDNKKFVALQTMLGNYGASLAAYIGDV